MNPNIYFFYETVAPYLINGSHNRLYMCLQIIVYLDSQTAKTQSFF